MGLTQVQSTFTVARLFRILTEFHLAIVMPSGPLGDYSALFEKVNENPL
jgi:hypothetical protein